MGLLVLLVLAYVSRLAYTQSWKGDAVVVSGSHRHFTVFGL